MPKLIHNTKDFSERLQKALATWPNNETSRRRMAPSQSYGRQAGPASLDAKVGAVVMLLYPDERLWHLALTVRPTTISRHGGQICLPGGLAEGEEDSQQTASRELAEELGQCDGIEWLGHFHPFFVYVSNVLVTPWLAVGSDKPLWVPDAREVAEIIELPLSVLLDPAAKGQFVAQPGPLELHAPCYHFQGHKIWGATAMMLAELAAMLSSVCAD